jgi:hypothetical protein
LTLDRFNVLQAEFKIASDRSKEKISPTERQVLLKEMYLVGRAAILRPRFPHFLLRIVHDSIFATFEDLARRAYYAASGPYFVKMYGK